MSSFLACSKCHEVVIKGIGSELKIRSKVLLIKNNTTYAVCKGCDTELEVPLKLDESMAKSLSRAEPRLYLKK